MLTEIKWSNRKIFMLQKNMYSVWKIYANEKYICSLKKLKVYLMFLKTYPNRKNICGDWIILYVCWKKNTWFKNTSSVERIMLIKNVKGVFKIIC